MDLVPRLEAYLLEAARQHPRLLDEPAPSGGTVRMEFLVTCITDCINFARHADELQSALDINSDFTKKYLRDLGFVDP